MGWLITLAVIILLAVMPLGVSARYDADGPVVRVIAGLLRFTVFPGKKKEKPKKEKPKKEEKKPAEKSTAAKSEPKKKEGGSLKKFMPIVEMVLDFLSDFKRKLRVNRLELKLILAGDDPADLATNYGRAWAAMGNLWPKLEEWFVIKKRNVEVECDFAADETKVTARLDLTITLGRLLVLAVRYGIRAFREFRKLKGQKKGGASA